MKMLNLKDFEGWVGCDVSKHDPPKGGWNKGTGRLSVAIQTVVSLFWSHKLAYEKGLSIDPLGTKMLNLKDFERWVSSVVNKPNEGKTWVLMG
jgi:hypothetical protein